MKLHGTRCRDWEDIAINKENGKSYIYLGDFGDNSHRRSSVTIYKFEEPEVHKGRDVHISANKIKHIHVKYPNNITSRTKNWFCYDAHFKHQQAK